MEIHRNQQFIQLWDTNIQKMESVVQQRLKQFIDEISKHKLDFNQQKLKIEGIHSLLKKIANCDGEKKLLARKSCEILDEYLTLLDENFISRSVDCLNGNTKIEELFSDVTLKKSQTDQPMNGKVLVAEWLNNLHSGETTENVNRNVAMSNSISLKLNFNEVTIDNMDDAKIESGSSVSDFVSQTDNFQIDEMLNVCSEMEHSHGNEVEIANSADLCKDAVSHASDESDYEGIICHCQQRAEGKMIACDNTKCKIRWYHVECVGIHRMPQGDWFWPHCTLFSI